MWRACALLGLLTLATPVAAGGSALPYPTSAKPAGSDGPLYIVNTAGMPKGDIVTLQTLSGVLARASPRIYVVNSDPAAFDPATPTTDTTVFWYQQMRARFGPTAEGGSGQIAFDDTTHINGDLAGLLRRFADAYDQFVRFDTTTNSTNAALITCAANKRVIAVGEDATRDLLVAEDLATQIADVSAGTAYDALIAAKRAGALDPRMAAFMPDNGGKAQCLSGYSVFAGIATIEDQRGGSDGFFEVLRGFKAQDGIAAGFGWTSWDEHELVARTTAAGGFVHAADFLYNLETHTNLPPLPAATDPRTATRVAQQKAARVAARSSAAPASAVHTVAFMMSDGDNLQILANDFLSDRLWFNPQRGEAPLGWSYAAAAARLMPVVYDYVKQTASVNDSFQAGPSGAGYAYPQLHDAATHRPAFAKATGELMALADMSVLNVLGVTPSRESIQLLMEESAVESAVYFTFGKAEEGYSGLHGNVDYVAGKPVVGARINLWDNGSRGDKVGVDALVKELAALPKDSSSPAGYSVVVVNMGSHDVSDVVAATRAMEAAGGFEVVLPEVLMDRLVARTARQITCPLPSGPFGDQVGNLPKCSIVGNGSCKFTCNHIFPILPLETACDLTKCHENLTLASSKLSFLCADGSTCPK